MFPALFGVAGVNEVSLKLLALTDQGFSGHFT